MPDTDPYKLVYDTIAGAVGPKAESVFRKFLHDGLLEGTTFRPVTRALQRRRGVRKSPGRSPPLPRFQGRHRGPVRRRTATVDDGRFNNNGWLQECPDPITKISWDNAIQISPRLAKELGIDSRGRRSLQVARKDLAEFDKGKENAHIVELTIGGRKLRGPAHIQPGLANYTVIVPLGYGRTTPAGSARARASTPTRPRRIAARCTSRPAPRSA